MILERMGELWEPPRGNGVEYERCDAYFKRAASTRLNQDEGKTIAEREKSTPSYEFEYQVRMDMLFESDLPVQDYSFEDIFCWADSNQASFRLRSDVFLNAVSQVKKDSSPGYPLMFHYPCNGDVPDDLLYDLVNSYLLSLYEGVEEGLSAEVLSSRHLFYPANCFVKGEATKESKIARLIYGDSLPKLVASIILLGDYINRAPETWTTMPHKVGMDMYTDDGLRKIAKYFMNMDAVAASPQATNTPVIRHHMEKLLRNTFEAAYTTDPEDSMAYCCACPDHLDCEQGPRVMAELFVRKMVDYAIVSDDIQGWEYQFRRFMHRSWYNSLIRSTKKPTTAFRKKMLTSHSNVEATQFIYFPDGRIVKPAFFIMTSGLLITHKCNSDTRAVLAACDTGLPMSTICTNGDDCVMARLGCEVAIRKKHPAGGYRTFAVSEFSPDELGADEGWASYPSTEIGFVHTDTVMAHTAHKYLTNVHGLQGMTRVGWEMIPFSSNWFQYTVAENYAPGSPELLLEVYATPQNVPKLLYNYCMADPSMGAQVFADKCSSLKEFITKLPRADRWLGVLESIDSLRRRLRLKRALDS